MLIRQLQYRLESAVENIDDISAADSRHFAPAGTVTCDRSSVPLDKARLRAAKRSYTVRRVDFGKATHLLTSGIEPRAGDVVLARVARLGQHKRIESAHGRRATMFPDDEIVVTYGARYASDQFHAVVPKTLGLCHLVAGGGIASQCIERHGRMKRPTEIIPIGLLADERHKPLNLADFALAPARVSATRPPVIAVLGTSMNAGKTTTAANLIRGMSVCGMKVGAAKVTGTGAGCDRWFMTDAGASRVLDFTDAGYPSTYRVAGDRLEEILETLIAHLCRDTLNAVIIELADGLLQADTAGLVCSETFRRLIDGVILAAGDSMGAGAAVQWLDDHKLPVLAVSGLLTASPLIAREAGENLNVPVVGEVALRTGAWLPQDRLEVA